MGWKTDTMLIRPAALDGGPDKLLADLGYDKRRKINDTPFSTAGAGSIWVGAAGDCVILYTYLAAGFFDDPQEHKDVVDLKNALARTFPEADIAALFLQSVVGGWGFAVFRHGTLIRRQYGHDDTIVCDEGSRLPVEDAFLSKFRRVEADGEIRYTDPAHPEYEETASSIGESLVFEICRSFTGFPLDKVRANGTNFWLNDDEAKYAANTRASARPWWKFWG